MAEYAPCPQCSCTDADKVSFTWWGGLLGPALLTHVRCQECGTTYNGKTGKSNNTAIAIYTIVGMGLAVFLGGGCCILGMLGQR